MERPNVLILYTDQQRWDALGCAGNPHIHTPHLDALAASGALLRNAFCNAPVCMPSRQSMLSGLYPSVLGTTCNGITMPEDALTLHRVLNLYGYHTANNGKLHFLSHSRRNHREPHPSYGFDQLILSDEPGCYDDAYIKWVEERVLLEGRDPRVVDACRCATPPAWEGGQYGPAIEAPGRDVHEPYTFEGPEELTHTAFVADETINTIRRHKDGPFFAIAGFYAPHAPLNPPARFLEWYDPAALPPPIMNPGENGLGLSDEEWRVVKAHYYALVSHVDDQVGRILRALDEEGLRERTLVVFTSDHGEHLGDHGRVQKGPPGFDSCMHVPLIVSWPGRIPAGQRQDALVEAVDIAPTLLDCCGVQIPPQMQGRSLRALLEGRPYAERDSVYLEYRVPMADSWKAARTHEWKYCAGNGGRELLFDLRDDPHELTDLSRDPAHRAALEAMRHTLLQRWFDVESQYPLRTAAY